MEKNFLKRKYAFYEKLWLSGVLAKDKVWQKCLQQHVEGKIMIKSKK